MEAEVLRVLEAKKMFIGGLVPILTVVVLIPFIVYSYFMRRTGDVGLDCRRVRFHINSAGRVSMAVRPRNTSTKGVD